VSRRAPPQHLYRAAHRRISARAFCVCSGTVKPMDFDVVVTREARCTRVRVAGQGGAGRVLSLLQLLALDSATWPAAPVLLDLRQLQPALAGEAQLQVAEAAAGAFGQRRVGLLATAGAAREVSGLRAFDDEAAAEAWLAAG
jgi:hypothetical protein